MSNDVMERSRIVLTLHVAKHETEIELYDDIRPSKMGHLNSWPGGVYIISYSTRSNGSSGICVFTHVVKGEGGAVVETFL